VVRLITILGPALAVAPAAAHAAVVVNVEHREVTPSATDQTLHLDVYLTDPDNVNERLNVFSVWLRGPANSADGVRFVPSPGPPSAAHPYVFRTWEQWGGGLYRTEFDQVGGIYGLQPPGQHADISESYSGLFSAPVLIPAGTPPAEYPVVVTPEFLILDGPQGPVPFTIGPPAASRWCPSRRRSPRHHWPPSPFSAVAGARECARPTQLC
jgi:hypothetical protein